MMVLGKFWDLQIFLILMYFDISGGLKSGYDDGGEYIAGIKRKRVLIVFQFLREFVKKPFVICDRRNVQEVKTNLYCIASNTTSNVMPLAIVSPPFK